MALPTGSDRNRSWRTIMATSAPNTGAPSGATIISFPTSPAHRFRVELACCENRRAIDRWLARLQRDNDLTREEYEHLALAGLARGRSMREGGC